MTLCELQTGSQGVVSAVLDNMPMDPISHRMRELGFVPGEQVRLVAQAPLGGDPLLIQVGYTRFALRRSEAARVQITPIKA